MKFLLHDLLKVRPCRESMSDLASMEHLFCLQGFRIQVGGVYLGCPVVGEGGKHTGQEGRFLHGENLRD